MPARKYVAPELIAEAKYLYENTLTPTDEIGAKMGLSRTAFYLRVKEWKWQQRRYSSGAAEAPAVVSAADSEFEAASAPTPEPDDAAVDLPFAARLQRVVNAQMEVIERTLRVLGPASNIEAERTARILATLSRTVQEIVATAEGDTRADAADDDPIPDDIDEFRYQLARRIRGFIEARRQGVDGISDQGKS
jgi:hypothetical protein